jgi:rubrerythrin
MPSKKSGGGAPPAAGPTGADYLYDAPAERTEILWKCLQCGELRDRNKWALGPCPSCGSPPSQFVLVDED